ncbi:Cox [Vibrio coralliirubri]|uniref:hypothetical protein n=1 Tax=Vibrio coralliirubri TaxID=1516159 RepID=UPI000631DDC5|nr:hypothetical protein [Vibrio coralliirubri]CDT75958.1 Cox [Vibrio coralliirubri]
MLTISPVIPAPFVTYEEYSRISGLPLGTIKDYVSQGKILVKEKGKTKGRAFVNIIAMHELAAREAKEVLG